MSKIKTPADVFDFLREKKKRGVRRVIWRDSHDFEMFFCAVQASWPIEFGYKLPTADELHGMNWLGMKHFIHLPLTKTR